MWKYSSSTCWCLTLCKSPPYSLPCLQTDLCRSHPQSQSGVQPCSRSGLQIWQASKFSSVVILVSRQETKRSWWKRHFMKSNCSVIDERYTASTSLIHNVSCPLSSSMERWEWWWSLCWATCLWSEPCPSFSSRNQWVPRPLTSSSDSVMTRTGRDKSLQKSLISQEFVGFRVLFSD